MVTASAPVMSLGKHWIIECYECNRDIIDDPERLEAVMLETAANAGGTVMGSRFQTYEPQGVSGVVFIAESHLAVHSWPEYRYAAIDIFSCGESIQVERALEVLRGRLDTDEVFLAGDLARGIVGSNGLERSSSVSIRPVQSVHSWRSKFEIEDAWGMLASVDVHGCEPARIQDEETVRRFALELCGQIGMNPFGETLVVDFGADERVAGFSLVQLIDTSLISGHFSNRMHSAYVDVFSCKYFEPELVGNFTKDFFNAQSYTLQVTLRK